MDSSQDFKSIQEKIQSALVATTRLTNQIAAEDLNFHRSSNPDAEEQLDDTSARLLSLATSLLTSSTKGTELKTPKLEDGDDIDVHWTRIVDVVDTLLEKADTHLDEYTGLIKRRVAPTDQTGPPAKKPRSTMLESSMRRANIIKPQNAFEVKPNNLSPSPWKPLLTIKPHALVPLEESLVTFQDDNNKTQYKHPYEAEITSLEYPNTVFQDTEPIKYQPVETTTATYVDTFEGVLEMLQELKEAKEIAIDTEHHDFRTYAGLMSLMQISTREKDWIVDTLQPWRHKLEVLNEVFADPNIIKVLHGSFMDIIWLQRDCGLYIVGLFDTFEAAVALEYPSRSLAYLLKRFIDFDADKKYQLADWRIRPLPEEMFYYARSDTHYLLYIYDMMRNELLKLSSEGVEKDPIRQVLDKSKETSLRRYETCVYDSETGQGAFGWYNLLIRNSSGRLSKEQFAVFRAVHKWRDEMARREDESALFVMSNQVLFDISRRIPPDPKALHSLVDPTSYIAKRDAFKLSGIINKAKAEAANGPSVTDVIRSQTTPTMAIGHVANVVFPKPKSSEAATLETQDLVSQTSKLWGKLSISSRWEERPNSTISSTVQFELPWAHFMKSGKFLNETELRLSHRVIEDDKSVIPLAENPQSSQLKSGASEPLIDTEFTLKAGLKRKVPESESESESESNSGSEVGEVNETPVKPDPRSGASLDADEISLDIGSDEKKAKRREKNARRKATAKERRAKKLAKRANAKNSGEATETSEKGSNEDQEPFDYSKAKSVLNAKRANGTPQGAKFNPYGMTIDGPKAARRMHGEKTGKSATFRK